MKTTLDLPDELLDRAQAAAVERHTTLVALVSSGLELALNANSVAPVKSAALDRLRKGLHLEGRPLTRAEAHERHPVS